MPTFEVTAPRHPAQSSRSLAGRCRRKFLRFFPRGFRDDPYLSWERGYKIHAHEQWEAELGRDTFGALLREGRHAEAATRAVRIESRTNLLFSFERWPFETRSNPLPALRPFPLPYMTFSTLKVSPNASSTSGATPSPTFLAARRAFSPGRSSRCSGSSPSPSGTSF